MVHHWREDAGGRDTLRAETASMRVIADLHRLGVAQAVHERGEFGLGQRMDSSKSDIVWA